MFSSIASLFNRRTPPAQAVEEEEDTAELEAAAKQLTADSFKLYLAGRFDEAVASSALQNEVAARALSPGPAGADALVAIMALSMRDLDAASQLLFGDDLEAMAPFRDLLAIAVEGENEWHGDTSRTTNGTTDAAGTTDDANVRFLRQSRRITQHRLDCELMYDLSQWVVDVPIKVHWVRGPVAEADTLLCILPGRGNLDELGTMGQAMEPPPGCNIAGIAADDGQEYAQSKNPLTKFGEQLLFGNRLRKFLESRPEPNLLLAAFGDGCAICWQVLLSAGNDLPLKRVALLSAQSMLQRTLVTDEVVRSQLQHRRLLWAFGESEDINGTFDATADWLSEAAPAGATEVAKYADTDTTMAPGPLMEAGQFLFCNRGWL
eukprot:gnl/MRDRNA2_/MRDRNA2_92385_c0_seq1.p1 gnl/MRDRNA2_/MRDRNA2_92385_c0~~gnl/MRDRNA2_/MRDRNA2_92385_c0_seq1.p1  ORF type:complete len:391 (+),score=94.04 gnl/MRDRNA2_/MRDRNA2_92385_c0_seq1:44-1174(+)